MSFRNIKHKMSTFYKAEINVPTFTIDNESPFLLDISEAISENDESEVQKSNKHVEPIVNQMVLKDEYQNYIYIANSLIYRNQLHQLNRDPIFDKNYYVQKFQNS